MPIHTLNSTAQVPGYFSTVLIMADVYAVEMYQGQIENRSHYCHWVAWEIRKGQLVQCIQTLWPYSTACEIIDRIDASDDEVVLLKSGCQFPRA
jgi:hypothetical protein